MGLLDRLMSPNLSATWGPTDDRWYQPAPGVMTAAGERVDAESAQKISAWYRGRDIIATMIAMLPLHLYERLPNDGGSEVASGHPLYEVLHDKPNDWQDSFQWRRQKAYHLIDHGNAYDLIVGGRRGFVDQLQPIDPALVTPKQIVSGLSKGRILYDIRDPKTGRTTTHTQDEIFHLRGASSDGVTGVGVLAAARQSLGTALATDSYAAKIFSNGTLKGGVIETPGQLDDDAGKRLAQSVVTAQGNWHMPWILEQGAKYTPSTMTPEDAQMLLSRKFSVDDMARWLGIPRMMLENNDPSFGNAEQFNNNFIAYSMGPWLSLFEFAIKDQLILNPARFYAEFNRFAVIRGDIASTAQADVAYVNAGVRTVDEIRAQHNWNKRGGKADELREPQNITGKAAVPTAPEEKPAPKKAEKPESSAKAQAIAIESAARLLRKEVQAVSALAVRHAADEDAFIAAVSEFYVRHASLVAATLAMTAQEAEGYCAGQCKQLIAGPWYSALDLWREPNYAEGLASLALEQAA